MISKDLKCQVVAYFAMICLGLALILMFVPFLAFYGGWIDESFIPLTVLTFPIVYGAVMFAKWSLDQIEYHVTAEDMESVRKVYIIMLAREPEEKACRRWAAAKLPPDKLIERIGCSYEFTSMEWVTQQARLKIARDMLKLVAWREAR